MNTRKKTVHTLESLLARTEDYGDCMEWTGYCQNKAPYIQHGDEFLAVRKLIWRLLGNDTTGKLLYGNKCGNKKCVNPDHIAPRNMKAHATMMAKNVDHQSITRVAKLSKAAQKRKALTDEQVSNILLDHRSTREIADDFGVSKTLICRIKAGRSHKMVNAKNNPFWGLMA